jgi:hypothetical protein
MPGPSVAPHITITLRARSTGDDLTAGMLMASAKGRAVYRIVQVTRTRRVGGPEGYRLRLVCERLSRSDVPEGATIMPWCRDQRAPRQARRVAIRPRLSADPGPPEPAAARIARIRAKAPLLFGVAIAVIRDARRADELAQLARAARVGVDTGRQHGRDYGPGIRLEPIRGRRRCDGELRAADVEIESAADPDRPTQILRRARRSDPLVKLQRAGTVTGRGVEAIEFLRGDLEAAQASIPSGGQSDVHMPAHQRIGITDFQVNACTAVRRAVEAVKPINRQVVLWIACGGTIAAYAAYAHLHHVMTAAQLKAGAGELADHYFGRA